MLDISQHTAGDPGASSSPFSELAVSDGARPTDLDIPMPDIALLLDQQLVHERLHQSQNNQNGWTVNSNGPTNIQRQEPSKASSNTILWFQSPRHQTRPLC